MKPSPILKTVNIVVKILMFLLTLAFTALVFLGGYFMAEWYPSFTDLRMGGIMMVLSVVLFVFSFLIFRKKNFSALLLIISVALLAYGAFVYNEGFGNEADEFMGFYLLGLFCLYCVSKLIERKL
jgi:hypothetical protein